MSSFVPPLFENLGKAASDLFKKKFDYKNQVQLKHKSKAGLTFTSTGGVNEKGVSGTLNVKHKQDSFGEVETEVDTAGKAKAEVKAKKLSPGVVVTVKGESHPKRDGGFANKPGSKAASVKTTVDYTQDFFAGSVGIDTSFFEYTVLNGAGVIGFDGLSVGAEAKLDVQTRQEVDDYNVGAEYTHADITGTVKTENKGEKLTVSYIQKVSGEQNVGAAFTTALDGSDDRVLKLGTDYKIDAETNFKVKGEAAFKTTGTEGIVAGVIEHRLKNPALLFALSSSYKVQNVKSYAPQDFGIALTFGDFE
jgi:hypothetical protein